MRALAFVWLAWLAQLAGCTTLIPGTLPHDLVYDARRLERDRCDPTPVDPHLYSAELVQSVEPLYQYVMGGPNGREAHLSGAELHLRPLPGLTTELLERGLSCHAAQLVLGRATAEPDDPYVLPAGWVKLDVSSGGASFNVKLTADDPGRAHEVVERATRFVHAAR
jgi:hypothetical protein